MIANSVSMNIDGTQTINVALSNIVSSDFINWSLPSGSPFTTTNGVLTISAGEPVASFQITSNGALGSGTQSYTLTLTDQSGTISSISISVTVVDTAPPNFISVGGLTSCAMIGGVPKCWGYNYWGELGDGNNTNTNAPTAISVLVSQTVQAILGGELVSCAISNGALSCWGYNAYGELGDGTTTTRNTPAGVVGLGSGVSAVAVGENHVCAIVNSALYCWGYNAYGQLGLGDNTNRTAATAVPSLTSGVTAVAAGSNHTCVIQNGAVKCFGNNANGELGNGTNTNANTPVAVAGAASGATSVAAGTSHSCAIISGAAYCWGYNGYGQIGDGTAISKSAATAVTGLTGTVTQITAGDGHSCAIAGGGAFCWGYNGYGELGNGTTTSSETPVAVTSLSSGVTALVTGQDAYHTCALQNEKPLCWGRDDYGQLGDGANTNSATPVNVTF